MKKIEGVGEWMVTLAPNSPLRVVSADTEETVATVHGTAGVALRRALLIARAPTLRRAVQSALTVFYLIERFESGRAQASARDMIPVLESVLSPIEDVEECGIEDDGALGRN